MFCKVIACEVVFREICWCAAHSPNLFELEFLSQGYHDNPDVGLQRLQERIDRTEPGRYDAILLGYGLCNNMLSTLRGGTTPVVIPRAHDCITFLLGSKERYQELFSGHPGTYYYTPGWLEHRQRGGERPDRRQAAALGQETSYDQMVAKYGEENARYLADFMGAWTSHYTRGTYIDFEFARGLPYREQVRDICAERGWEYQEVPGDLSLLQRWLNGSWDDAEFLVLRAGDRVRPSYDAQVIQIDPSASAPTAE